MPTIASSVERVPRSRIRELAEIAMSMEGVLRLYFGESNLPTPAYIKQAAIKAMQDGFTGKMAGCPEPLPRAEHRCWTSHAEKFFTDTDHLVQVAGISVGQIKKLKSGGIATVAESTRRGEEPYSLERRMRIWLPPMDARTRSRTV